MAIVFSRNCNKKVSSKHKAVTDFICSSVFHILACVSVFLLIVSVSGVPKAEILRHQRTKVSRQVCSHKNNKDRRSLEARVVQVCIYYTS